MTRHHHSGGSSSSHHSGSDTPDTSTGHQSGTGGPGGDGVDVDVDHLDTMSGRLQNTGGRVDAVGTTLDGINVGPQSMGIVGSGFTGAAESHVRTAREHVTRTRQAVDNAQAGTTGTARTYADTDTTNAQNLGDIDTSTDAPTTHNPGTTTPSSAAQSGTGTSTPPTTHDQGTSGTGQPGTNNPPVHTPPGDGGGPGDPPGPPRSPTGDDGSWHGEHGLSLTPAQNAAADDFLDRARRAEPGITNSMQGINDSVPGSQLVGLDYRLKADESFKRKLATAIADNPDLTISEHLADMKDSVRYTMQVPPGSYTPGVQHAVDTLQAQGYENVKFKNTWDSDGYQGINSMWRDPNTGQVFEVQFHTQDSFDAKMVTHELYEQARLPGVDDATRAGLDRQQADVFNSVPRPPGASDISVGRRGSSG